MSVVIADFHNDDDLQARSKQAFVGEKRKMRTTQSCLDF
jgi:hypothetical protein